MKLAHDTLIKTGKPIEQICENFYLAHGIFVRYLNEIVEIITSGFLSITA